MTDNYFLADPFKTERTRAALAIGHAVVAGATLLGYSRTHGLDAALVYNEFGWLIKRILMSRCDPYLPKSALKTAPGRGLPLLVRLHASLYTDRFDRLEAMMQLYAQLPAMCDASIAAIDLRTQPLFPPSLQARLVGAQLHTLGDVIRLSKWDLAPFGVSYDEANVLSEYLGYFRLAFTLATCGSGGIAAIGANVQLSDTDLPAAVVAALWDENVRLVGQLMQMTDNDLLRIPSINRNAINIINLWRASRVAAPAGQ